MRTLHCLVWRVRKDQSVLVDLHVVVLELAHGILFLHLRVVYMHDGSIVHQHFGHKYSGGLPHVASVLLECEAEHRDLLVGHCVKEAGDDAISEGLFLVLVHATTDCQYFATSTKPSDSQMYTRFKISFWKHEPPKPTEAPRNFAPMRVSAPMARETS